MMHPIGHSLQVFICLNLCFVAHTLLLGCRLEWNAVNGKLQCKLDIGFIKPFVDLENSGRVGVLW